MRFFLKRHARWVALLIALMVSATAAGAYALVSGDLATSLWPEGPAEISQSDFVAQLDAGEIASLKVTGNLIEITDHAGTQAVTTVLWTDELRRAVSGPGIALTVEDADGGSLDLANDWLDVLLKLNMAGFLIFGIFFMAGMFRMPTRRAGGVTSQIRFADVAGVDEARAELAEVVDFLRHSSRYAGLGASVPRGVLMVGPPGTGKTLLARAVAGEAGVPFFAAAGSDFVEMYVGVGAARLRKLFRDARKQAPCILFIDEIDALARARGAGAPNGGQIETENTLNQLLAEMDGFARCDGLIVMAATNRVEALDPAALRPGRFDRQIHVGHPDLIGRKTILGVHAARVALAGNVDLRVVARGTPGMTGAELANLVNEAALTAARFGRVQVTMSDFEQARDRIIMGSARALVMSEAERQLTAYHEAGHALVALRSPDSDPVHKVTIVPRGRSLGMMMRLLLEDRFCLSRAKLEADLAVAMGGRAAEELIFGRDHVTTGAAGDIQAATEIAARMVGVWGMSDRLGMVAYGSLGATGGGEATPPELTEEVRRLIDTGYSRAWTIVTDEIDCLHALAAALLDAETLEMADIRAIVDRDGASLPLVPEEVRRYENA
jgi:cell division protease FtsH